MHEDDIERLEKRLERERQRREEAERLAESSTRDLYRRTQQLESLKEEHERLLWVAYHHLQEPVRGVVSQLQMLERELGDEVSESARESLELAMDAARRQHHHVNALLEYAEATADATLNPDPVNLTRLVEATLRERSDRIDASGASVELHGLPRAPVDPDEFRLLFEHLLEHLLDQAGASPEIHVGGSELPQAWLIEIQDRAVEIDEDHRYEVFQLFSRTDGGTEAADVGLAICQAIVRRHGGEITFEPREDGGTLLRIRLPKGSAGAPRDSSTDEAPGSA